MKALRALAAAGVVLLLAGPAQAQPGDRYNQVRQKSVHNAYAHSLPLRDQLEGAGIRSLELDLHNGRTFAPEEAGDWYVYHFDFGPGRQTSCERLSECLGVLRAYHDANPLHDVVTVWLDLKDRLDEPGHEPEDLDRLLSRIFPPEAIFRPFELATSCPAEKTLAGAVRRCGWPRMDQLVGRFMFVLTGSELGADDGKLDRYVRSGAGPVFRNAFIAPAIATIAQIGLSPDVLFYNLSARLGMLGRAVFKRGFVGRVWGIEDEQAWSEAVRYRVQHIATDCVAPEEAPWAAPGFQCIRQ